MIIPLLKEHTTDALMHYAGTILTDKLSPGAAQHAVQQVAQWISFIPGGIAQDQYVDEIFAAYKKTIGKKRNLQEAIAEIQQLAAEDQEKTQEQDQFVLPRGIDKNDVYRDGFYQIVDGPKTGIYFRISETSFASVSNVVIEPLFHNVIDEKNSNRVIRIDDGVGNPVICELPSSALLSRESFRKFLFDQGAYFFSGTQTQLDRINQALLRKFPKAFRLDQLGQQPEGFFAYYNYAFNGELKSYNDAGLVEVHGKHFYSPAISQGRGNFRQVHDQYENERKMQYTPPPFSFTHWANLIKSAYPDHYRTLIGAVMLALFRDIHFRFDRNCPHIFFYGPVESGKTKAAQSITDMFFRDLPGFPASGGTDAAFGEILGRCINVPVIVNEFDVNRIDPKRFNIVKNAYEGEGRPKMGGDNFKKSESNPVTVLLILVGQYLPSIDDNSVPSRSIIGYFPYRKTWPKAQKDAFKTLTDAAEKQGLTGIITELMALRPEIEKTYARKLHATKDKMAEEMDSQNIRYRSRVLQNYCVIPTFWGIVEQHMALPCTAAQAYKWAFDQVVSLSATISESDMLRDFWDTLETLVDQRVIKQNVHFKRRIVRSVEVTATVAGKRITQVLPFDTEREVMYISLTSIIKEYNALSRRSTGQPGIDKTTLENYLRDRDYYIGWVHSTKFVMSEKTIEGGSKVASRSNSAFIIDIKMAGLESLFVDTDYNTTEDTKPPKATTEQAEKKDDYPF